MYVAREMDGKFKATHYCAFWLFVKKSIPCFNWKHADQSTLPMSIPARAKSVVSAVEPKKLLVDLDSADERVARRVTDFHFIEGNKEFFRLNR